RLAAELSQASGERQVLEGMLDDARTRIERGDRAAEELALLRGDFEAQRGDFEAQRASLEAGLAEARAQLSELEERAAAADRIEDLERQSAEAAERSSAAAARIEYLENQQADAVQR